MSRSNVYKMFIKENHLILLWRFFVFYFFQSMDNCLNSIVYFDSSVKLFANPDLR